MKPAHLLIFIFLWFPSVASAGNLILDQPHDFRDRLSSEEGTEIVSSRAADDFAVPGVGILNNPRFSAEFIVSSPNAPLSFAFDVYLDDGGQPGDVLFSGVFDNVTDLGPWNGDPNLHVVEVQSTDSSAVFVDLTRLWFSPYAVGNGSGTDRAWWGTSGDGDINGSQAMFMSESFGAPDWIPVSDDRALGFASDFAFTVEAVVPAPGALALIAFGLLSTASRRRK